MQHTKWHCIGYLKIMHKRAHWLLPPCIQLNTAGINTVRLNVNILLPFINFENLLYIKHNIRTFTVIHKVNFENTLSIICPLES